MEPCKQGGPGAQGARPDMPDSSWFLQHSLPNSTLDQAASAYKPRVTEVEGLGSEGPVPALMSGGQGGAQAPGRWPWHVSRQA